MFLCFIVVSKDGYHVKVLATSSLLLQAGSTEQAKRLYRYSCYSQGNDLVATARAMFYAKVCVWPSKLVIFIEV